jgi:hypothetical protein
VILTETRRAECFVCDWTFEGSPIETKDAGIAHRSETGHQFVLQDGEESASQNGSDGFPCKIKDCGERALRQRGPTAYLCPEHAAERAAKRHADGSRVGRPTHRQPASQKPPSAPSLDELLDNVLQAQSAVDEALKRRDAALATFDAEVERSTAQIRTLAGVA